MFNWRQNSDNENDPLTRCLDVFFQQYPCLKRVQENSVPTAQRDYLLRQGRAFNKLIKCIKRIQDVADDMLYSLEDLIFTYALLIVRCSDAHDKKSK